MSATPEINALALKELTRYLEAGAYTRPLFSST